MIPADFLYQADFAAALPLADGKRLGEVVDLHIATSRQAYEFRKNEDRFKKDEGILAVGGLTYSDPGAATYLPGSLSEVEKIASLAKHNGRNALLMTAAEGAESTVLSAAAGKAVLHFATHGFFVQDGNLSEKLLNAGFSLSGAKPEAETKEDAADNTVYARELLGWNLRQSQLVVISSLRNRAWRDRAVTSTGTRFAAGVGCRGRTAYPADCGSGR